MLVRRFVPSESARESVKRNWRTALDWIVPTSLVSNVVAAILLSCLYNELPLRSKYLSMRYLFELESSRS